MRAQGCDVIAVGDDVAAAADLGRAEMGLGDDVTYTDAGEMAAAIGGAVDGVIVASHTCDHARHATPCIEAGLNVYLEKPITDDLAEAFDFIAAVRL